MPALLFSPKSRQRLGGRPFFLVRHGFTGGSSAGAEGSFTMAKVRSFLRSTPSRLGRRIAQFVTIAAASLPEVGA
jgi:hypothetical protein